MALWTRMGTRLDTEIELAGMPAMDCELRFGVLYAFDLPRHGGTLIERWTELAALELPLGVRLVPTGTWADALVADWEGVVYKRLGSRYPTRPVTREWVKFRK